MHIAQIHEAQRLRGWITNSYAQIEFMLGDLILRSRQFSEYDSKTSSLPHGAPDRVKRVRQILSFDGPLSKFSTRIETMLLKFEQGHEVRNLLAHGFCEFLSTTSGDTGIQFQKWHRRAGKPDARLVRCFRLPDLVREERSFVALAEEAMTLFWEIHEYFGWVDRPAK